MIDVPALGNSSGSRCVMSRFMIQNTDALPPHISLMGMGTMRPVGPELAQYELVGPIGSMDFNPKHQLPDRAGHPATDTSAPFRLLPDVILQPHADSLRLRLLVPRRRLVRRPRVLAARARGAAERLGRR